MQNNFSAGIACFIEGLRLLRKPRLLPFVLIPLLINVVLYIGAIALSVHYFSVFSAWFYHALPNWLHWLGWLIWPLFILVEIVVVLYTFTLIATIIASPFNGLLAEKAQRLITGQLPENEGGIMNGLKEIPKALQREWQKFKYFVPWAIGLIICFFIPFVQVAAPFMWFFFMCWMMTIQYIDYPMDNNGFSFPQMKALLKQSRGMCIGFGLAVMVAYMIPIFNFLCMPAAVVGSTVMFSRIPKNG